MSLVLISIFLHKLQTLSLFDLFSFSLSFSHALKVCVFTQHLHHVLGVTQGQFLRCRQLVLIQFSSSKTTGNSKLKIDLVSHPTPGIGVW